MIWDDYLEDLSQLTDELEKEPNTQASADGLRRELSRFAATWGGNRSLTTSPPGVPLPVPRRGNHPVQCDVENAWLTFTFVIDGDDNPIPKQADFEVRVTGSLTSANLFVELEDHWRVDTHLYAIVPVEGQDPPNEPHARYHFQRGGDAMTGFSAQAGYVPGVDLPERQGGGVWRALMQNDGPRVPHLPMCPILALDYSLGQHNCQVLRRLRETSEYGEIVRRAQTRLWLPFFQSLARVEGRREWLGELIA